MSENANRAIILLSGGLDSVVSFGLLREKLDITLALTFDYGQKSLEKETAAAKWYCDYYKTEHKIIKLSWLKEITNTSLVSKNEIPDTDDENSAKSVWVPNRNGLFLNIAGAYADSFGYNNIIIGANKEEAQNFPDNTKEFIERINSEFEFSTQIKPKVITPLINCDKEEIVKLALENKIPLDKLYSCYRNMEKHCGKCPSCVKLKKALIANNAEKYLNELF
ncbi:7-cyano-7-deazaguanine synthase QueC [bacterium]|nr:7-cyano-7-deazaguanine synthase QueC [bacterium]